MTNCDRRQEPESEEDMEEEEDAQEEHQHSNGFSAMRSPPKATTEEKPVDKLYGISFLVITL